jgi:hypothetical protein
VKGGGRRIKEVVGGGRRPLKRPGMSIGVPGPF